RSTAPGFIFRRQVTKFSGGSNADRTDRRGCHRRGRCCCWKRLRGKRLSGSSADGGMKIENVSNLKLIRIGLVLRVRVQQLIESYAKTRRDLRQSITRFHRVSHEKASA